MAWIYFKLNAIIMITSKVYDLLTNDNEHMNSLARASASERASSRPRYRASSSASDRLPAVHYYVLKKNRIDIVIENDNENYMALMSRIFLRMIDKIPP